MKNLIEATELNQMMQEGELHILDASIAFQIPGEGEKIVGQVIPGALRFDYDGDFADPNSGLPHTMPSSERFNHSAQHLGLMNEWPIVVYDNSGTLASPRAWWMLKAMGHKNVKVLNGGLPAWIDAGFDTDSDYRQTTQPGNFNGQKHGQAFVDSTAVLEASQTQSHAIIDARSLARFHGTAPEPRAGMRSGHIPNAQCLPFSQLIENGKFKPVAQLQHAFDTLTLDRNKGLIFSCGSGVTACILLLAADELGYSSLSVYDGSWAEWGSTLRLPIEKIEHM
ncbi:MULTISPECIES: sulfurtransferase [unclassified Vibrio]|uniref:Sulfurtransferase n=1 Tax=Vibrio sp. HB236076 TaxID=3232307 RepID=A0AB39HKY9_9VIBR|nr:sulfurtransferase [Vibrio sp. HB161653]MDP5253221.1 sulfurtransferase [Vibrio sp. HB161653]